MYRLKPQQCLVTIGYFFYWTFRVSVVSTIKLPLWLQEKNKLSKNKYYCTVHVNMQNKVLFMQKSRYSSSIWKIEPRCIVLKSNTSNSIDVLFVYSFSFFEIKVDTEDAQIKIRSESKMGNHIEFCKNQYTNGGALL